MRLPIKSRHLLKLHSKSLKYTWYVSLRNGRVSIIELKTKKCQDMKDWDNVMKYCTAALRADEAHEEAILCMARIYSKNNDPEQCQMKCSTLLRLNPSHEEAAMMLADIMLQKEDNESAIYHFQNVSFGDYM